MSVKVYLGRGAALALNHLRRKGKMQPLNFLVVGAFCSLNYYVLEADIKVYFNIDPKTCPNSSPRPLKWLLYAEKI